MNKPRIKTNINIEVGLRIRESRLDAKMSQLQLGVALGVSDKTVSGYESGRISPSIDKLTILAELFKKPVSFFLGDDPREYKVASRLRAVEIMLKEIREHLHEIKLLSQDQELDK